MFTAKMQKEEKPIINPPIEVSPDSNPLVIGWRDPKRKIGCCPNGDKNGKPFSVGMGCCVDQIFNATKEFCCLSKSL